MKSVRTISILFIYILISVYSAKSQSKYFKEKFMEAEYYFMNEDYKHALPIYLSLYEKDSTNTNLAYRIGLCYFNSLDPKGKRKSLPYFEKAIKSMTGDYNEGSYKERKAPYDAMFYLANDYRFVGKYDKAIEYFERFKKTLPIKNTFYIEYVNREIQATRNAKELMKYKVQVQVIQLDSILEQNKQQDNDNMPFGIVNDSIIRNCPVVSDDEKTIVFTQGTKNRFNIELDVDEGADYQMDSIYYSKKINGKWTKPKNISPILSSHYDKMVPTSLNADGTELYLVIDKNDNGDIYVSEYYDGTWHKAKKLNKNINTKYWESHACISADGKALYFTSDRPGGYGGMDIYVSYKDDNEDWGPAINLGKTINTPYDEETPFILNDGKTLYFSSQGHYNMGGFDVFHSRKMPNGKWSTPLNLGYPISTVGNDLFYLPKKNGEYAFFALNSNERDIPELKDNDIYALKITPPKNQMTEIILKGTITLQDNNPEYPKDLAVYVIDTISNDTIKKLDVDRTTGKYNTILSAGAYNILYKGSGYKPENKFLYVPEIYTRSEIVLNVELVPLEVSKGKYYVIKSILFDYGKYDLRRDALIEIEKLYQLMKDNPTLYVEVIGHTDSWGSKEFNQKLSEKRARAVVDYLVSKGISPERFVARGMGEEQPIAINENPDGSDNPEGRQLNRRVEIKIIKSDPNIIVKQEIYVPENLKYNRYGSRNRHEQYTVLLAKSPKKLNITKFDTLTVNEIPIDSLYYYTVGVFKEKSKALKLLNKALENDFKGASIMNLANLSNMERYQTGTTNGNAVENELVNNINDKTEYTIQIKALTKPVDVSIFKNLETKKIREFLGEDGIYRYTYGKVKGRENAKKLLKDIISKGYTDAFIVKYDKFERKDKGYKYTIQISSTTKHVKLTHFKNLKGVREYIGIDGMFKYVYGKYKTMDAARKDLKKVRKLGYTGAFIVNLNKYKR
jgi:outer membrane protein OmpA-like peptidoglycan-associated protein/TPR repeat protein